MAATLTDMHYQLRVYTEIIESKQNLPNKLFKNNIILLILQDNFLSTYKLFLTLKMKQNYFCV